MKKLRNIFAILMLATFIIACKNETKPEVKTVEIETAAAKTIDQNATYAKAEFTIDGMTCAMGCAATIEKKIAKMDGVKSAKVDFDKKLAMVEYNEAKVNPALLEATVTKVSDTYKVSNMKVGAELSGKKGCDKSCTEAEKAACAANGKDCGKACTDADKAACAADSKKGKA